MRNLNDYLVSVKNFSGCVLVAHKGNTILAEGYGFADKSKDIKNTPQTNFCIGSITKSMTALSIMQLVEKNTFMLSSKVEEFLPGVYEGKGITIHHLLSQTSGIPNDFSFEEIRGAVNLTSLEIVDLMSHKPLKFEPGRKWTYSNTNYMLLALVIEKVTGKSYQAYITESVFEPAGMTRTCFFGDPDANIARHGRSSFNCTPAMTLGAGNVVSNAEDLYLYSQALYTGSLVSSQSIDATQMAQYNGRFVKYGYGWFINNNFGHKSVSHGGFLPNGYTSHIERYTDDALTIIVLSNELEKYSRTGVRYFGSTDIARSLAAKFFGRKAMPWQKLM